MQTKTHTRGNSNNKANLEKAANILLNDGKKLANALYQDGLYKIDEAKANAKEYSDEMLRKVQKNPMASIFIAGGIGFLLSMLLRKR